MVHDLTVPCDQKLYAPSVFLYARAGTLRVLVPFTGQSIPGIATVQTVETLEQGILRVFTLDVAGDVQVIRIPSTHGPIYDPVTELSAGERWLFGGPNRFRWGQLCVLVADRVAERALGAHVPEWMWHLELARVSAETDRAACRRFWPTFARTATDARAAALDGLAAEIARIDREAPLAATIGRLIVVQNTLAERVTTAMRGCLCAGLVTA